jgi:two-component system cell cycle sensor histidine kinase/response regulator CckA
MENGRTTEREKLAIQAGLLELTQDALIMRDLEDRIQLWNKGAERLYGWASVEALGQDAQELLQDSFEPGFESGLCDKGEWTGKLRQTTKDGKTVFVRSRMKVLRDEAGSPRFVLIANSDITEQIKIESQLLRVQRMEAIGGLFSGIAHDLNNELAPMLFAMSMLEQKQTNGESRRWFDTLRVSTQRAGRLITQLLSFTKGSDEERTLIRAGDLIQETVDILRSTFPKSIDIKSAVAQELWPVQGNATHLQQVLINLCLNARDAMPAGGVLTIEAENVMAEPSSPDVGNRLLIKITDTGIGIPLEIIDKIFDPFFTTKHGDITGTGLGLFTVSRILANHNGSVKVSSTVGHGAQFQIYLPVAESAAALLEVRMAHAQNHDT